MILLALLVGCSPPPDDDPTPAATPAEAVLKVVVLGSGTPIPDPERSGPAIAVVSKDQTLLVDAGAGVVRRMVEAAREEPALSPLLVDRVFLTHLHSDHTVGLPDLWLTPWVVGRDQPLHVHGPKGTAAMVEHLQAAWADDLRVRTEGTEKRDPNGARLIAHETLSPGPAFTSDHLRVDAVEVNHGQWEHAWGYRFETEGRVVVISGDTAYSEEIARACNGCDLLVHEVFSEIGHQATKVPGRHDYHPTFHTSTVKLAELAAKAKPKKLVLVHQLFMGVPEAMVVQEIAQRWDGEVVSAHDLDVFSVP